MRTRIIAIFVALLLVCGVAVHAVTWGQPDGKKHPHVGTLLFLASDGYLYSCSGTLLSPTVIVTAAHCTSTNGVPNLYTWVNFDEQITFPNNRITLSYLNRYWIKADAYP